jgi:type II secretory pathway pseudopilin PulG
MAIFSILLAIVSSTFLGSFASASQKEFQMAEGDEAMLISSTIVLKNNCSAELWLNWSPSTYHPDYGLSPNVHVSINATALDIENGSVVPLWSKASGAFPIDPGAESERLVPLDNGSVVLLVVEVW